MNEKERGNKHLFPGLKGYPDILLERLRKTINILSQGTCSHQGSNRVPPNASLNLYYHSELAR